MQPPNQKICTVGTVNESLFQETLFIEVFEDFAILFCQTERPQLVTFYFLDCYSRMHTVYVSFSDFDSKINKVYTKNEVPCSKCITTGAARLRYLL